MLWMSLQNHFNSFKKRSISFNSSFLKKFTNKKLFSTFLKIADEFDLDNNEKEIMKQVDNINNSDYESKWNYLTKYLLKPNKSFDLHEKCFYAMYNANNSINDIDDIKPMWYPCSNIINNSNIGKLMNDLGMKNYKDLYNYSIDNSNDFWDKLTKKIGIVFDKPYTHSIYINNNDIKDIEYYKNGNMNIVKSIFQHGDKDKNNIAIKFASEHDSTIKHLTFATLDKLSNHIAYSLQNQGFKIGDRVGICMSMTVESIAIYLGIVRAGGVVVGISDSFSSNEIATRLRVSKASFIFTSDVIIRGKKRIPLQNRINEAINICGVGGSNSDNHDLCKMIVIPADNMGSIYDNENNDSINNIENLIDLYSNASVDDNDNNNNNTCSNNDIDWYTFLKQASDKNDSNNNKNNYDRNNDKSIYIERNPSDLMNILFSSGTTGDPKAIPWTHSTPIKCAIDGYLHQNITSHDTVCWPTNLGWMMGPWLLFQMINGCSIALYDGPPTTSNFCSFVTNSNVSCLGLVPSIVSAWKNNTTINNNVWDHDWSNITRFSSSGEASDENTMLWLSSRVSGYAPIIEYCGGTELAGSYMSSSMVQPNAPATFSTPILGVQFCIIDEEAEKLLYDTNYNNNNNKSTTTTTTTTNNNSDNNSDNISGEVALCPPSLGFSTKLLNRDHNEAYYDIDIKGSNDNILRRHGDGVQIVPINSLYSSNSNNNINVNDNHIDKNDYLFPYYFRAMGRCDDTMNLGGIKVSSVEIERAVNHHPSIVESAAVALTQEQLNRSNHNEGVSVSGGGPSKLVIVVVLNKDHSNHNDDDLLKEVTKLVKQQLNPLFHVEQLLIVDSLPRTASNKVMRRQVRKDLIKQS